MDKRKYYTVQEFNTYVKNIFDAEELLHNIPIAGEVSGCSVVSSHCYFTLKDKHSQISVVCFDCKRTYTPKNGEQVIVTGRPDFYIKGGRLSLNAYRVEPFGVGKLLEQLEKLKQQLKEEGLFDISSKKPVPLYPNNIAIITSAKGAALQDILTTIYKKNMQQKLTVIDVRVQGENASSDIIKALKAADSRNFDVIVIARGGGSFEDLVPFNDEKLVRAIYALRTPVLSAVGHETDYSLCDFVADERAITPTAAGERIGYDIIRMTEYISSLKEEMSYSFNVKLNNNKNRINYLISEISHKWKNLFVNEQYKIRDYCESIKAKIDKRMNNQEYLIASSVQTLEALSPAKLLQKGYFRILKDDTLITKTAEMKIDDIIDIYAFDGNAKAKIINKKEV